VVVTACGLACGYDTISAMNTLINIITRSKGKVSKVVDNVDRYNIINTLTTVEAKSVWLLIQL
jgi:hypothetical protein